MEKPFWMIWVGPTCNHKYSHKSEAEVMGKEERKDVLAWKKRLERVGASQAVLEATE